MSVLTETNGSKNLLIKGAPDYMLKNCTKVMAKDGKIVPLTE